MEPNPPTREEVEELRKVALAATQEAWFNEVHDEVCAILDGGAVVVVAQTNTMSELTDEAARANATHIATFGPPTALWLLSALAASQSRAEKAEQALAEAADFIAKVAATLSPEQPGADYDDEAALAAIIGDAREVYARLLPPAPDSDGAKA